jgi:putative holliday junction resolvase
MVTRTHRFTLRTESAVRTFDRASHVPLRSLLMRYLGLDLGRATIGIALADDVIRTARALETIRRSSEHRDLAALRAIAVEYEVERAVLGLPMNMDGSEGASARLSRSFAPKLEAALGVPVELFDERLSTFEAESRLRERGFSGRAIRHRVDAEAAAVILQGWMDRSGV